MTRPAVATYTVEWLLAAMQRRGLISDDVRRDVEIRAPAQRARVLKDVTDRLLGGERGRSGGASRYEVGPAEIVGSLQLPHPDGGVIDEDCLAQLVAAEVELPYHKIDPLELDMMLISRTLSRPFALRYGVIPLSQENGSVVAAVSDPFDMEAVDSLRRITRTDVKRVISSKSDIIKSIVEIYGFRRSVESAAKEQQQLEGPGDFEQLVRLRTVGEAEATDKHVVNAVDFLLRYAFDQRASDIHIEPKKSDSKVRLRIDGVLHGVHSIPRRVHSAVMSRLKGLARMDIAEKRRPQDGRIKTKMGDVEIELRVSTLPTAFGEKMVIRIFDPEVLMRDMHDLGFDPGDYQTFENWIGHPHGIMLITGPTGSGKTTTLYTALKALADDSVNITTVEDPIELVTDRFNQVAVQPKAGVTFAAALRSILRQDPDIIMIGEIRDPETAEMAVQAALTGHLVLATLHTNDSVGAVTRLMDLDVPPFLVASTLVGVMAQRLVRRVCAKCGVSTGLTPDQLMALGVGAERAAEFDRTVVGEGCVDCRGTGYYGRVGLFELFDFSSQVSETLIEGRGESDLRRLARQTGMRTLRESGLQRLAEGRTTFEEVVRVVGASTVVPE